MELEITRMYAACLALVPMIAVALGLSYFFATFISSVARNPSARPQVQTTTFIGMALIEMLGLFSFVIACIILFVV